tara:strand:- start:15 stop:200 length:186 start_codon:yes stop_codon:yes gene_type:complete
MVITSVKKIEHEHFGQVIKDRVVLANIDGQELYVPTDPANRHYAEILKQVAAGDLTIADAD